MKARLPQGMGGGPQKYAKYAPSGSKNARKS